MHFDYIFCKSQTTFHNTSYSPILAHVKNMVWAQAFLLHQYLRNPESSWVNTTHWVNKEIITPHISKWFQDTINKWKPLKANTVAWTITKVWKNKTKQKTIACPGLIEKVYLLHKTTLSNWEKWILYLWHWNQHRESRKVKTEKNIIQKKEQDKTPERPSPQKRR